MNKTTYQRLAFSHMHFESRFHDTSPGRCQGIFFGGSDMTEDRNHALSNPTTQTAYKTSTAEPHRRAARASNRLRSGNTLKMKAIEAEIQPKRAASDMMDHRSSDTATLSREHAA